MYIKYQRSPHEFTIPGQETLNEQIWSVLDRDKDGIVRRSDAETAMKKYKKTLNAAVAIGILKSFDKERRYEEKGMDYDNFCKVMNRIKVEEGDEDGSKLKAANKKEPRSPRKGNRDGKPRKLSRTISSIN